MTTKVGVIRIGKARGHPGVPKILLDQAQLPTRRPGSAPNSKELTATRFDAEECQWR